MSELQEISDRLEILWQANSFTVIINEVKSANPEWYESNSDKFIIFNLIGHQEFFSSELISLKRMINELENKVDK